MRSKCILSDHRHRDQNRNVSLKRCGVCNYTTVNQGVHCDLEMFIHHKWQREKEMWPIVRLWRRKPQVNMCHVKINLQFKDEVIQSRTRYKCGINLYNDGTFNNLSFHLTSSMYVFFFSFLTKELKKIYHDFKITIHIWILRWKLNILEYHNSKMQNLLLWKQRNHMGNGYEFSFLAVYF